MATDLAAGREWPETGNFPRVTLCDFSVCEPFNSISGLGACSRQFTSAQRTMRPDDQHGEAILGCYYIAVRKKLPED